MSGNKGMTHYSLETKLQAIRLHEEEGLSYARIAQQLGMRKASRIEGWCSAYRREGELAFHRPIGRPRKAQGEAENIERLQMENALLKKLHTELRKAMLARRDIGSWNTTEESTR
jgi:transposase